ncbi:DNA binding domain-containing protein, excisionase family [Cellulosimicrobium cellulans]|nr:DNA binding domain-containing protein, excisionase family [Cellulosimicrobium cellulans]
MSNIRREYITAAEAADLLGVDRRSVVRFIDNGDLTALDKLPGRTGAYLFNREDVERFAEARSKANAS